MSDQIETAEQGIAAALAEARNPNADTGAASLTDPGASGESGGGSSANKAAAGGANLNSGVNSDSGQQNSIIDSGAPEDGTRPDGPQDSEGGESLLSKASKGKIKSDQQEAGADGEQTEADSQDPASQPIKDWKAFSDTIAKDKYANEELLNRFGEEIVGQFAVTPKLAEALIQFHKEAMAADRERIMAGQLESLKEAFGPNIRSKAQQALNMVGRLAQLPGMENLEQEFDQSGLSNSATAIKMLAAIPRLFGEEALSHSGQAASDDTVEDALAGIKAAFAEARGRR